MHSTSLVPTLAVFVASALVISAPAKADAIETICGQYQSVTAGDFSLSTDLWGESSASSGSQCAYLDWDNGGNEISWQTSWTWEGGNYNVKSYTNVGLNMGATQLNSITSMPTSWSWR
jgi:xyloglucan-specific endo-beta-1,4-glucanase